MEKDITILKSLIEDLKREEKLIGYNAEVEIQALENLIKGYREKEESEKYLYDAYQDAGKKMFEYAEQLEDSIPKSKVLSIMRDIEKRVEKLFNSTFIPISPRIYNDNKEKYEPMYIGREIAMTTLKALQELMEDK